jgi:hypothetical protein
MIPPRFIVRATIAQMGSSSRRRPRRTRLSPLSISASPPRTSYPTRGAKN